MTRLLAALLSALLLVFPAYAGTGTITTKDAGGVTRTFDIVTDGSGNFNPIAVVCDGTAAANCAAVKASSTAAAATDPALVVAISPNGATVAATQSGTWNIGTVTNLGTLTTLTSITNPVTAAQATAANLNATVVGTGTFAVQATLQASATTAIGKVDPNTALSWNTTWAGGTLGAMSNYGTSPGAVLVPGVNASITNTPAITLTSTTLSAPDGDRTVAPTAITTAGTATLTINSQGSSFVQWTFSSFANGTITFQLSDATGSAFNNTQCFPGSSPYTLVGSVTATNGSWFCPTGGAAVAKIVMTGGGGTATVSANASAGDNSLAAISSFQSAIPAGTNIIGKVGIDQTTPGTTNGVQVNAALPAGTNSIGSVNTASNVTATACSSTITTGGTAQNAFTAQTTLHGFTIANIDTTEPLWISFTTTAAASGTDSYPLPAATAATFAGFGSFTAPPGFGLNHALSVIAATTSHKFSCTWW